jgi:hypothetical protein
VLPLVLLPLLLLPAPMLLLLLLLLAPLLLAEAATPVRVSGIGLGSRQVTTRVAALLSVQRLVLQPRQGHRRVWSRWDWKWV